jgi:hypothetical protein
VKGGGGEVSPAATHTQSFKNVAGLGMGPVMSVCAAVPSFCFSFFPIFLISSEERDSPCPVGRETNGHFLNSWTG